MNALLAALARIHRMDDAAWARHANPLSVWTRAPILPLTALCVWARVWIGWWALAPIAALAVWTSINPRAFSPPATLDSWSARAVMGERLWLDRTRIPIPVHHCRVAPLVAGIATLGLPFLIWGLWRLEIWPTLFGLCLNLLGKFWFLDRMVWIFHETRPGDA